MYTHNDRSFKEGRLLNQNGTVNKVHRYGRKFDQVDSLSLLQSICRFAANHGGSITFHIAFFIPAQVLLAGKRASRLNEVPLCPSAVHLIIQSCPSDFGRLS